MSLLLALALPLARQLLTAMISGKPSELEKLPADLMTVFYTEVFKNAATQQATLERIEAKLDESMDQDFKREYLAALTTLDDSARARSVQELESGLKQAWDLLIKARAGVNNRVLQSDADLAAAMVALRRQRVGDALVRAKSAWNEASDAVLDAFLLFRRTPSTTSLQRARWTFLRDQPPQHVANHRRAARELCVEAGLRAENSSALLGELGVSGHPMSYRVSTQWWHGAGFERADSGAIRSWGRETVETPWGGVLRTRTTESAVVIYLDVTSSPLRTRVPPALRARFVNESELKQTGEFDFERSGDMTFGDKRVELSIEGAESYVEVRMPVLPYEETYWMAYLKVSGKREVPEPRKQVRSMTPQELAFGPIRRETRPLSPDNHPGLRELLNRPRFGR